MVKLPGLPSLAFLEFYSLFFFEIFFSVCLFFIIFQDKEKESTQQMGILQEVRILFSCPAREGWGGQASPGTHPAPALLPTLCPVSMLPRVARVSALDHVAPFACARGRRLSWLGVRVPLPPTHLPCETES